MLRISANCGKRKKYRIIPTPKNIDAVPRPTTNEARLIDTQDACSGVGLISKYVYRWAKVGLSRSK